MRKASSGLVRVGWTTSSHSKPPYSVRHAGDGVEVPQAESGAVGRVPVTDTTAVQVALAWVDAVRLPVGDDGTGGPVERARGLPPVQQMFASMCAVCRVSPLCQSRAMLKSAREQSHGAWARIGSLATGADGWTRSMRVLAPVTHNFYAHVIQTTTIWGARSRTIDR